MAEQTAQYRLKSPMSRVEPDAEGKPQTKQYQAGDVITPTEEELKAFGDRLEPVTETPAPVPDPVPDETTPRSRR
jgi:hypothetical protein